MGRGGHELLAEDGGADVWRAGGLYVGACLLRTMREMKEMKEMREKREKKKSE